MRLHRLTWFAIVLIVLAGFGMSSVHGQRQMERLGRGVVAINQGDEGVFVSWRLLGTDSQEIAFNLYRQSGNAKPVKLNDQPVADVTWFKDAQADLSVATAYVVRPVIDGAEVEGESSGRFEFVANPPAQQYLEVPLKERENYYVHFVWVGDLTGDGEYDFVVDRLPRDNPDPNATQKLEAYRRDGTLLWVVDMGPQSVNPEGRRWNAGPATISHGHNDGVTVYDLDFDGRAEVIIISARGVVFGDGQVLDEGDDVQQFISVLDGLTGAERARAPVPQDFAEDGPVAGHFGIAYLDGMRPSFVFKAKNRRPNRGPFNLMINAWSFDGNELKHLWKWVRDDPKLGGLDYHQIRIVDLNGDGRDAIVDGGYAINHDGTLQWYLEDTVHGDRFHIGKLDPDRPGLQGFGVQQNHGNFLLHYYYDATTGEVHRRHYGNERADIGRGIAADVDPNHRGYEYWAFDGIYNAVTGEKISENNPWPNFRIWWDGDAGSEILNRTHVDKWDPETGQTRRLLSAHQDGAVRTWRDAPVFYGDILGDWREEVIYEHGDRNKLMIFTTTIPTDIRLYTLPHNPAYRAGMTVKGYKQSHMVDYYLGYGMEAPPRPRIITPDLHEED